MKKSIFILSAAAVLSACTVVAPDQGAVTSGDSSSAGQNGVTFVGAALESPVEAGADGKTYFGPASGSSYGVNWSNDDAIQINGCNSTAIAVDGTDPQMAQFAIGGVVDYPYCAAYPAAAVSDYAWDAENSQGSATVLLPAVQHYTPGSFDPAAGVMLGYAASGYVAFHNALAYLKVTVSGGSNSSAIKKIRVRSNVKAGSTTGSSYPMSGEFTATFGAEGCTLSRAQLDASSVTLDCGDGVAQGTAMIIAIPAQTYTKGINLFIASADDKWQEVISSKNFDAEAGIMYATGVAFNGDGGTYEGEGIYTETDWNALSRQISINSASEEFKDGEGVYNLYNDITTTSLQRFGGGTGWYAYFEGTLNGNNHTVTTTAQSVPLFSYVSGTIKNLNLAGSHSSISNSGYGTASLAVDICDGGVLDNVTASCDVHVTPTADANVYLYGLCRNILSGAVVKNCTQAGTFTIDPITATTKVLYVPVFAYSNAGQVKDCNFTGSVTFTDIVSNKAYVAPFYKNTATMEHFVNTGNVTVLASNDAYVGGISIFGGGYMHNCYNGESGAASTKGTVSLTATPSANGKVYRIGGISVFGDGESASNCGRYYGCKNYANLTLTKTNGYIIYRSGVGGIIDEIRDGAYAATEGNSYCTLDGCTNSGHLTVWEQNTNATTDNACPLFLGGIVGKALNRNGTNTGYLVFGSPTPTLNGIYFVIRNNCRNTGTLEMASPNPTPSGDSNSGARINYVGGIAGFVYGYGRTTPDEEENDGHYGVVRGKQNGIIKLGSSVTGCFAAGGFVGGCCYAKLEQISECVVTYEASTLTTKDSAPQYRGMIGATIGWVVKYSRIGVGGTPVSATLTDKTGLNCSASIKNQTSMKGYLGITGKPSVHRTSTKETHSIEIYGLPTYNGESVTQSLCYGGGNKAIKNT